MSDKDKYNIPRREIAERIAKLLGHAYSVDPHFSGVFLDEDGSWFNPIQRGDQYDAIINQPDVLPHVYDVLDEWFSEYNPQNLIRPFCIKWWYHPEYLSDIHAWTLRAYICWKEEN